ncbi:MAG: aspartate kinase [Thaumarchaeota archaeon]|nr:aspartate kinase [Nitrososphaerota archaeon]
MGESLGAKEVILIKDVDTVFSSDPDMVEEPVPIGTLDSEEAFALSLGGAKFLHAKALQYKAEGVRIRIASMEHSLFSGTVIDGGSLDLMVELSGERISMIAIVGLKLSDSAALGKILDAVRTNGANLISLGLDPRSLVLHVSGGKDLENKIHSVAVKGGIAKAVSVFEDLSMITVKGSAMETSPGMIQRITQPLARAGINVYALVTISSSIRIFIRKEHADKAVSLLQDALLIASKKGE